MPSIGADNLRNWTTSPARAPRLKVWPKTTWGCRSIRRTKNSGFTRALSSWSFGMFALLLCHSESRVGRGQPRVYGHLHQHLETPRRWRLYCASHGCEGLAPAPGRAQHSDCYEARLRRSKTGSCPDGAPRRLWMMYSWKSQSSAVTFSKSCLA